jgi:hypothetical protein
LFEGCTRDINNWEVPSKSKAVPRHKREGAEGPRARKRFSKGHPLAERPSSQWSDLIFLGSQCRSLYLQFETDGVIRETNAFPAGLP